MSITPRPPKGGSARSNKRPDNKPTEPSVDQLAMMAATLMAGSYDLEIEDWDVSISDAVDRAYGIWLVARGKANEKK